MSLSPGHARPLLVFAIALVVVSVLPGTARAAGEEDAAVRHGLELRREGKDRDALEEFQKAYAQHKSPRTLAQIGLAEQALGRWVEAETHVGQAVADESHPWIRKNTPVLKGALAEIQRHLGSLEIDGPVGADVRVNGQIVGTLPFSKPARVPIGMLNVEVRKEGYLPTTRPVSIATGALTRESISLQTIETVRKQPVEMVAARTADVAPSPSVDGPPPAPDRVEERARRDAMVAAPTTGGTWHRTLAWSAGAAALLGAAGGGVALLIRNQKLSDANKLQCRITNDNVNPVDPANGGRCLSLADSASNMGMAALIAFSAAGALAIASGVLFATLPPKASETGALACAPVLSIPGAVCQLRF